MKDIKPFKTKICCFQKKYLESIFISPCRRNHREQSRTCPHLCHLVALPLNDNLLVREGKSG